MERRLEGYRAEAHSDGPVGRSPRPRSARVECRSSRRHRRRFCLLYFLLVVARCFLTMDTPRPVARSFRSRSKRMIGKVRVRALRVPLRHFSAVQGSLRLEGKVRPASPPSRRGTWPNKELVAGKTGTCGAAKWLGRGSAMGMPARCKWRLVDLPSSRPPLGTFRCISCT